jgi:hypothetical protein
MVDRFLEGSFTGFFEGVEGAAFEGGVGFDRVKDFITEFSMQFSWEKQIYSVIESGPSIIVKLP